MSPLLCTNCGRASRPGDRCCRGCGLPLGTDAAEAPARTQTRTRTRTHTDTDRDTLPARRLPGGRETRTRTRTQTDLAGHQASGVTRTDPFESAEDPGSRRPEQTVVCLDDSGSMAEGYRGANNKLGAGQDAGEQMIDQKLRIDPNDELALIAFNHKARVIAPLQPVGAGQEALLKAIRSLSPGGGTNLQKPVQLAGELLGPGRTDAVLRLVLMTDGTGRTRRRAMCGCTPRPRRWGAGRWAGLRAG